MDGKILLKREDYDGSYAENDPEIEIRFFGEEEQQDTDVQKKKHGRA